MTCRDETTGKFTAEHQWEFGGYGTDVNVDVDSDYVHVLVRLVCHVCDKETETDNSWLIG